MEIVNITSSRVAAAMALLALLSCKSEIPVRTELSNTSANKPIIQNASAANLLSLSAIVYGTRSISFDRANGTYTLAQGVADFGNITQGWNESRAFTTGNVCQIKVLKNALSSASGMIAKYDIEDGTEYTTSFRVKFHTDFELSRGGKLGTGLMIGDGAAGGVGGMDGNGGSLRLVWHKYPNTPTGDVYFQAYAYHKDQPDIYGSALGRFPATGSLTKNVWYDVTLYVKSNTGTLTNGRAKMIINGTTVVDQAMRWTMFDAKRFINKMEFATFRGGSSADYQSSTDSYIYYENLSWQKLAN
jgi:hypothetical protein